MKDVCPRCHAEVEGPDGTDCQNCGLWILFSKGRAVDGTLHILRTILMTLVGGEKIHRIGKIAALGIALPLGLALVLAEGFELEASSRTWPHVIGRITESNIGNERSKYGVRIKYEYTVDNITYSGKYEDYKYLSGEAELNPYKLNEPIFVYYDPLNPGSSVGEPGVSSSFYNVTAMLLVLYLFGFYYLVFVTGTPGSTEAFLWKIKKRFVAEKPISPPE